MMAGERKREWPRKEKTSTKGREKGSNGQRERELWQKGKRECTPKCIIMERRKRKKESFNTKENEIKIFLINFY
jgi:hypothetical protein